MEDAFDLAKRDDDQWEVMRVIYFKGNVHLRNSLEFIVEFESDIVRSITYNNDTRDTLAIKDYALARPWLKHLTFSTTVEAQKYVSTLNATKIANIKVNDFLYIHLRRFDLYKYGGYDKVLWNDLELDYVVRGIVVKFESSGKALGIKIPLVNKSYVFTHYEFEVFCFTDIPVGSPYKFSIVEKKTLEELDSESLQQFRVMMAIV